MAGPLGSYLRETRRPIYSAALLLPFFLIYHTGTFFLKTTYINGADALIIRLLSLFSVHSIFASAIVLIAFFAAWQVRTKARWKIDKAKLAALFLESTLFALFLFFVFGWLSIHFSRPGHSGGALERLALYCGAGIYEELVFRGFLLGSLVLVFTRVFGMRKGTAGFWGMILAALLFSAFHYLGPASDTFSVVSFLQRMAGGLYFSMLFVTRGFGVTAASHAIYDILVGLLMT
jgi:membrane protease YdiL (CAAX protease family)